MPVTVDFDNDARTIVRYVFESRWTWDDFYVCWDWMNATLDASDHKIAMIVDMRGSSHIPVDALLHARALERQLHPNYAGALACVGMTTLSTLYTNLVSKLAPEIADRHTVYFVSTLEEAHALLDDWLKSHET